MNLGLIMFLKLTYHWNVKKKSLLIKIYTLMENKTKFNLFLYGHIIWANIAYYN